MDSHSAEVIMTEIVHRVHAVYDSFNPCFHPYIGAAYHAPNHAP